MRTPSRPGHAAPVAASARALVVLAAVVVLADQLSKAWAWRHVDVVGRTTIDSGGGVLDTVLGGAANAVMADPLAGAFADVAVAALLLWCARRVLVRRGSTAHPVVVTILLAAATSNLLDRLGLHRVTAPGSARGVVNWIPLGGAAASPANAADLAIVGCVVTLAATAMVRRVRRAPVSERGRVLVLAAAAVVTAVSLAGALGAADGSRERVRPSAAPAVASTPSPGSTGPGAAEPARPPAVDRGAPLVVAGMSPVTDDLQRVVTSGDQVTVTWSSETVTVQARTVLGWRVDGVSALYLRAVVAGPTRVELYLPPPAADGTVADVCQWRALAPRPGAVDPPAAWECGVGPTALSLSPPPVLFPS